MWECNLYELNLDLYLPFLFFLLHFFLSLSIVMELQISPRVSLQVRFAISSKVLDISAICACCSFQFIYFISGIYLSLCPSLKECFLLHVHVSTRGFFLSEVIKMDGSVCVWSLLRSHCIQACTPRISRPRKFCFYTNAFGFLKRFLCSVLLCNCK